jgi:hypothetical protein
MNVFNVFLPKIRIKNLTGFPIVMVGIKSTSEDKWGNNRLMKMIPDEKTGRAAYPVTFSKKRYDILVFDAFKDKYQINDVKLHWNMLIEVSDHNQIFRNIANYYDK